MNHARSMDNLRRLRAHRPTASARSDRAPAVAASGAMNGERLPASYANFYIANGVCSCRHSTTPTIGWRWHAGRALPSHRVVGIHAVDLVWGLVRCTASRNRNPLAATAHETE